MTHSRHEFNTLSKGKAPPPFSLCLTFEERARLEREAAGMSLGAYIRERLFGESAAPPRRTRGKFPVKDQAALGRALALLGGSRLSQNLNQLSRAVDEMRAELLRALGKADGGKLEDRAP